LVVEGYNELIVLNEKELCQIKKYYRHIGNECAGATMELQNQIIELKDKIKEFEHEMANKALQHKNELMEKDIIITRINYEKDALSIKLDTDQRISELEKNNYLLQIQMLNSKSRSRQ
jgi:Na+/phosphate symporter